MTSEILIQELKKIIKPSALIDRDNLVDSLPADFVDTTELDQQKLELSNLINAHPWTKLSWKERNLSANSIMKSENEELSKKIRVINKAIEDKTLAQFDEIFGTIIQKERDGDQSENDGYGSDFTCVLHFTKFDIYLQLSGYYSSYDGHEISWDNVVEVEPREVMVIKYFKKNMQSFSDN